MSDKRRICIDEMPHEEMEFRKRLDACRVMLPKHLRLDRQDVEQLGRILAVAAQREELKPGLRHLLAWAATITSSQAESSRPQEIE